MGALMNEKSGTWKGDERGREGTTDYREGGTRRFEKGVTRRCVMSGTRLAEGEGKMEGWGQRREYRE